MTKTTKQYQGQSIYKVGGDTGKHLNKGDHLYLDSQHKDHLEVFNKRGNIKNVLNLDGTKNWEKTERAIEEGRSIKKQL